MSSGFMYPSTFQVQHFLGFSDMEPKNQEKWNALQEPLLESDCQDVDRTSLESYEIESTPSPQYHLSKRNLQLLLYVLGAAYIPLLILRSDLFPSLLASQAVKYEIRPIDVKLHGNKFAGDPRPELDAAWHELFEDIRIPVSSEDLKYYNLESIPLADGSGFAAELGVHHELHCLKKIRHWIYKDYYLVNETESELIEWKAHIDHCMEMMRETIMCRGDPSLSTFKWVPGNPPALTAMAQGHHQCVNWESLMSWVRERAVPIFEPNVLQVEDET